MPSAFRVNFTSMAVGKMRWPLRRIGGLSTKVPGDAASREGFTSGLIGDRIGSRPPSPVAAIPTSRRECWRIFYDDVVVGSIAQCVGNPGAAPRWQWRCGFYRGSKPGECTCGTATDFDEARAEFETAWRVFLAKRTEADFKAWRDQRTERKYAGEGCWSASVCVASPEPKQCRNAESSKDSKPTDHGEHRFAAFRHRHLTSRHPLGKV